MKTKIKYESLKRAKDIANAKRAYKKYAKDIDEPIELQIYNDLDRFFNKKKYPPVGAIYGVTSLYYSFRDSYNLKSKYKCYIYDDIEASFQYLRMGAIYHAMAYDALQLESQENQVDGDYINDTETHEGFLYQAISVNEWKLAINNSSPCPIIQAMLNEEYEKAIKLLLSDIEESDESQEAYFIHMPYVKQIYFAMLSKDENEFNEQLAKRVNKYRKRPSDYQPVIDTASIALIKMAEKLGLQYKFRVEEIPEYFLEVKVPIERSDCKIIDLEKCKQAFEEWGDITPSVDEIREKIFI
ncbi:MAG: hypothetical protein J6B01_11070 [Ruminococcus sp.]|nr:hypothetical protein [Ruminococcus sp.]